MELLTTYLQKAEDFLRKHQIDKPRLEAQILLSHVLKIERYQLYTQTDRPLTTDEVNLYRDLITKKSKMFPTAYLTKEREFYGLHFKVDERVLIPRPETEELVDMVVKIESESNLSLLDMCTGSGCIAIALAKNIQFESVTLADISRDSLDVAQENFKAVLPDYSATFVESDLFENIYERFDIIIANPPYVLNDEYLSLESHVKDFEPKMALTVDDMMGFHSRLLKGAKNALRPLGRVYLETNPIFIAELAVMAEQMGFSEIQTVNDLSAKQRFLFLK